MSQRLTPTARTIWIADAHRDDGKRFIVRADHLAAIIPSLGQRLEKLSKKTKSRIFLFEA
jgi:hypothetical protein